MLCLFVNKYGLCIKSLPLHVWSQLYLFNLKLVTIRGALDIVSGRIIRQDSRVMGLSGIRPVIFLYPAGYRIICFSEDNCQFVLLVPY